MCRGGVLLPMAAEDDARTAMTKIATIRWRMPTEEKFEIQTKSSPLLSYSRAASAAAGTAGLTRLPFCSFRVVVISPTPLPSIRAASFCSLPFAHCLPSFCLFLSRSLAHSLVRPPARSLVASNVAAALHSLDFLLARECCPLQF